MANQKHLVHATDDVSVNYIISCTATKLLLYMIHLFMLRILKSVKLVVSFKNGQVDQRRNTLFLTKIM